MKRAIKISLKFVTANKKRKIAALLESYRAAVNFYIRFLWQNEGKLDKATLARLEHTRLSERYKSQALKQALDIVTSTRKAEKATGQEASQPRFKGGAILDAKFVTIEDGKDEFDLMIRLSTLHKRHRIWLPCRKTQPFNKWLGRADAELIQGCELHEHFLILWIGLPDFPDKKKGKILAVDIGANKVLVDSTNKRYGENFKAIRQKVNRKKRGSKGKRRALRERDNYINYAVNQLPWCELKVIGVEDLKNVMRGKKKNRGKSFRKAMAPWAYRRVLERLRHKAQEYRVHLIAVPPAYTSRTCPKCGMCHKDNRRGENFLCISCGYTADSDFVGAQNVLARTLATLRSVESLKAKKAM
jgi:IS605 OrfB family transposase